MTTKQQSESLQKWRMPDGSMIEEIAPDKLANVDKTYKFSWDIFHLFDVVHDNQGRPCFERDTLNGIALVPVEASRSFMMTNAEGRPISTLTVDKASNTVEWNSVWQPDYAETAEDISKIQSFIIDQGFTPYNKNPFRSAGLIKVAGQYHDVRALPAGLTVEGDLDLAEMRKLPGFNGVPDDVNVTGHYTPPPVKGPLTFKEKLRGILDRGPKDFKVQQIESGSWMRM